jgi:hypothetical protein
MKGQAFSIPSPSGKYYFDLPAANQNSDLSLMKCNYSFNKSQSKKLPPCQFDDRLIDARTGTQYVGTYIGDCPTDVVKALNSKKFNIPSSGWNKYFLGMQKYGPIIATAFGTFDCSIPYLIAFLDYAEMYSLSWVAFGVQPYLPYRMYKNNLNPCNLSCLTISALSPIDKKKQVQSVLPSKKRIGNYMECLVRKNCSYVLSPIGNKNGYGDAIQQYIKRNRLTEEQVPPKPSPVEPEITTTFKPKSPEQQEETISPEQEETISPEQEETMSPEEPTEEPIPPQSFSPLSEPPFFSTSLLPQSSSSPFVPTSTTSSQSPFVPTSTTTSKTPFVPTSTTSSQSPFVPTSTTSSQSPFVPTSTTRPRQQRQAWYIGYYLVIVLLLSIGLFFLGRYFYQNRGRIRMLLRAQTPDQLRARQTTSLSSPDIVP